MAVNRNRRELKFVLNDDDFIAFGRYRILYTAQGRKMVMRQRLTYIISGAMIVLLFTVFHMTPGFTRLAYIVAAVIAIGGTIFAERIVLKQQVNSINRSAADIERIRPVENTVRFDDDGFETKAGDDVSYFKYSEVQLVDLTEEAIYVWISDEQIMPLPLHCFRGGMDEMKEYYKWIRNKIKEQGGNPGDE